MSPGQKLNINIILPKESDSAPKKKLSQKSKMAISINSPEKKSCVSSVQSDDTHTSSSFNVYDNKNNNVMDDIERENII